MTRHLPVGSVHAARWLLPGDPDRVYRIGESLESVAHLGRTREFSMIEGWYKGVHVGVCSTGIGGPSTAIAAHELIELGATHLVRVGTCGSLKPHVKIGDVVVADLALGVKYPIGRLYPRDGRWQAKASLTDFEGDWTGPLFSTDWFYPDAPNTPPLEAIAVEMEAVYLFHVAEKHSVLAGAVCACSDAGDKTDYEAGIDRAIVSALDGIVR